MMLITLTENVYTDNERERLIAQVEHLVNVDLIASVSAAYFERRKAVKVEGSYVKLTTGEALRVNESPARILEMLEKETL